ncbi:DUF6783 domain-containing protein [Oliverpabstia intestinalis]|uniref:DUF6783 domain-containing protein n=1 Tax=Oliverpabstia intestinalis TaxID=2606633 RepID=UPI002E252877
MFYPHSVAVARYAALIRIKSPTNWDSQLTKSLFQTRSRACLKKYKKQLFLYKSKSTEITAFFTLQERTIIPHRKQLMKMDTMASGGQNR